MPGFVKGPALRAPFGRNVWLRSVEDIKTESRTLAATSVPSETIDGIAGQKILQPGTVLAKITTAAGTSTSDDVGKVGPFVKGDVVAAVNEVQTVVVDATGGTWTLTLEGEVTAAIAANATGAVVQTALENLSNLSPGDLAVVRSGSANSYTYTITFAGARAGQDVPALTGDAGSLTGGAGTVVITELTKGSAAAAGAGVDAGVTDGRSDPANIVGINNTFLPWQLMDRDVEVAVVYEATGVQAWCIELDDELVRTALSDATADAMRGKKGLNILFK